MAPIQIMYTHFILDTIEDRAVLTHVIGVSGRRQAITYESELRWPARTLPAGAANTKGALGVAL